MEFSVSIEKIKLSKKKMIELSKELSQMGFDRLEVMAVFSSYAGSLSGLGYKTFADNEQTKKIALHYFNRGHEYGKNIADATYGVVGHA